MSQCSESEDAVTVMNAATVVILRRVKGGTAATSAATKNPKWKVLLGQNLVKVIIILLSHSIESGCTSHFVTSFLLELAPLNP